MEIGREIYLYHNNNNNNNKFICLTLYDKIKIRVQSVYDMSKRYVYVRAFISCFYSFYINTMEETLQAKQPKYCEILHQ